MTRIALILVFLISGFYGESKGQLSEHIQLRDGTILEASVEFNERLFRSNQIVFNDSVTYSLSRIEAYMDGVSYYRRVKTSPFSTNDFARRVEKGNIDLYEFFEFKSSPMMNSNGYVTTTTSPVSTQFFSKDGGPIQKVNARNLKKALYNNPVSMEYLNKRDQLTAVQVIGAIAGAAIIGISISNQIESDAETINPTGLILGGLVVNGSIWLPHFRKQDLTQDAVRSYNSPEGDSWWEN